MPGAECATTAYIKVGARREKAPGGRGGSTSGERKNGERKSGERTEKEIRNACTWRKRKERRGRRSGAHPRARGPASDAAGRPAGWLTGLAIAFR